jgi:hypothetical protein
LLQAYDEAVPRGLVLLPDEDRLKITEAMLEETTEWA